MPRRNFFFKPKTDQKTKFEDNIESVIQAELNADIFGEYKMTVIKYQNKL